MLHHRYGERIPVVEVDGQLEFTAQGGYLARFAELYERSPFRGQVRDIFAAIDEIPSERRYRRLTAVAALEHICDLPLVLARAVALHVERRVLLNGIKTVVFR